MVVRESKEKLCIALVGDGSSTHVQRLASGLAQLGHRVLIITADKYGPFPELRGVEFSTYDSDLPTLKKIAIIKRYLKKSGTQILHSHYVNHGGFIGFATGFHPHLMSSWGCDVLNDPRKSKMLWMKTVLSIRAADGLLPVSHQLRERMLEMAGSHPRHEVINWGVDMELFKKTPLSRESVLKKWNLDPDSQIVFSPRSLAPVYNLTLLLEAWLLVLKAKPRARLIMLRYRKEDDYEEKFLNRVAELKLEPYIDWIDKLSVPELAELYSVADAVASVARSDGTPMTLLEAMACEGIPVVSDLVSLREYVEHQVNGFVVNYQDPVSISEGIISALDIDPSERMQMAERNRIKIRGAADQVQCLEKIESIYLQTLRQPKFSWFTTIRNIAGGWEK